MTVLLERFPYRYVENGTLENGKPDFRIQKQDHYTKRYKDMYLCDNGMQLSQAMEDFEYTKWLDPDDVPCILILKNNFIKLLCLSIKKLL